MGGVKKWLYALMGKSVPGGAKVQDDTVSGEIQQPQEPQESSVSNDIQMFKGFVKEGVGKAKSFMKPYAKKGTDAAVTTTENVKASVDNKFIKIVVRSFIVLFFAIILVFIAIYLFGRLKEDGGPAKPDGVTAATPTPITYELYTPSIYAEDLEILNLEEQINILNGEIRGIIIKETGINPPKLDWKVDFKN